mmetsp:Transcript_44484/g.143021  ORF Transcript_44484/g.143021 Transcript_44484/m.143021 type:complete len:302 (-) Transcript_44484:45-950(-)
MCMRLCVRCHGCGSPTHRLRGGPLHRQASAAALCSNCSRRAAPALMRWCPLICASRRISCGRLRQRTPAQMWLPWRPNLTLLAPPVSRRTPPRGSPRLRQWAPLRQRPRPPPHRPPHRRACPCPSPARRSAASSARWMRHKRVSTALVAAGCGCGGQSSRLRGRCAKPRGERVAGSAERLVTRRCFGEQPLSRTWLVAAACDSRGWCLSTHPQRRRLSMRAWLLSSTALLGDCPITRLTSLLYCTRTRARPCCCRPRSSTSSLTAATPRRRHPLAIASAERESPPTRPSCGGPALASRMVG